jgi:4-hydroxy-3-methylbut-2-en-1-yl diphosphate synthase IspG/GcpE
MYLLHYNYEDDETLQSDGYYGTAEMLVAVANLVEAAHRTDRAITIGVNWQSEDGNLHEIFNYPWLVVDGVIVGSLP